MIQTKFSAFLASIQKILIDFAHKKDFLTVSLKAAKYGLIMAKFEYESLGREDVDEFAL